MTRTLHRATPRTDDRAPGPQKRALSDLAPPTRKGGDAALAPGLFEALARAATEDPDTLTHGFHVYPARMHRSIAAHVLDGTASPGAHVVDPFCGSGTVLVEARVRGLASSGVDLSPLALRLAELKTRVVPDEVRARLMRTGAAVTERCRERVRAREAARAPISKQEAQRFEPHVLRELAVILEEVRRVELKADREALELVLSSLLTKLSKRKSDTDGRGAAKRIGRFIPTEMFGRKCEELVQRLDDLAGRARGPASVNLHLDDMRQVKLARPADILLTSPPYGGTYDYISHHDGRIEWLGLDGSALDKREIGARRHLADAKPEQWDAEVRAMLVAMERMLAPAGRAFLVMGDGEVARQPVPVVEQLQRLGPPAGLEVAAWASAPRRDWRRGTSEVGARFEHLVALRRVPR